MKHNVMTWADASEGVFVNSREDLDASYVELGRNETWAETLVSIKGTVEERHDFLRRLAAAATAEAERLAESTYQLEAVSA